MVGMTTPRRQGQWRWVAHPPWRPPGPVQRPPAPRYRSGPAWRTRTPAYTSTPRWGLPLIAIPRPLEQQPAPKPAKLAAAAPGMMSAARSWFVATAVAHGLRYAVLAWYAHRLAPRWLEAATTAFVWVSGIVAIAIGLAAALTATAWLVEARRRVYAPAPDPRPRAGLWAGCLVVVVNFFRIPVYLEELRRASPRAPSRTDLRRWWAAWFVNMVAVVVAVWRSTGEGSQAAADSVLLTALAALAASWAITETLAVMRSFGDLPPVFARRFIVKGIVTTSASRKE